MEATQTGQCHTVAFFNGFVQDVDNRIEPDTCRFFIGLHMFGQTLGYFFLCYKIIHGRFAIEEFLDIGSASRCSATTLLYRYPKLPVFLGNG